MNQTCRRRSQSNYIMELEKLYIVHKELTCQIIVQLRKIFQGQEITWEAITNWLVKAFLVDLDHQCMSVMAQINRSEPVYGELMALEGTPRWRILSEMHAELVCL